jgi:hypothetical protein
VAVLLKEALWPGAALRWVLLVPRVGAGLFVPLGLVVPTDVDVLAFSWSFSCCACRALLSCAFLLASSSCTFFSATSFAFPAAASSLAFFSAAFLASYSSLSRRFFWASSIAFLSCVVWLLVFTFLSWQTSAIAVMGTDLVSAVDF